MLSARSSDQGPLVERLAIQAGNWLTETPMMRVSRPPSRRALRTRGVLYTLVGGVGGQLLEPDLCNAILDAVESIYFETPGSITRALRAATLQANRILFERNLRAEAMKRILAGLACLVVQDNRLYWGQLGPAIGVLVQEEGLQTFPEHSIWLHTEAPGAHELTREPALGLRRDVEPQLFYAPLEPGSIAILASPGLLRLGSVEELVRALRYPGGGGLAREGLEALANGRDCVALIIEWREATSSEDLISPTTIAASPGTPDSSEVAALAEEVRAEARDRGHPSDRALTNDSTESSESIQESGPEIEESAEGQPAVDLGAMGRSFVAGVRRVRSTAQDALLQILPERVPERPPIRDRVGPSIAPTGKALVIVALIIPLVVFFTVVMTRIQYERAWREQLGSMQAKAQSRYDLAVRQEDLEARRLGLYDALQAVEQGLAAYPEDETLLSLKRRILIRLDQEEKVERLYTFSILYNLEDDAVSHTDSSRIVLWDKDLFVLNRGSDRVYHFFLNAVGDALQSVDSDPILLLRNNTYDGVVASDLVDLAWMGREGNRTIESIVVLDRAGTLFTYDRQRGVMALPVANSDLWLKPEAIGGYIGNLYVLDPLLGRILKYVPHENEYVNPPVDYLVDAGIDLTGAVDMAIDGSVYVLFADGQIRRFYQGKPIPFSMRGLPNPMQNPVAIFVSGPQDVDAEGYVYVADAGNKRVLQFDKEGNYLRQFRAKEGEPYMDRLRGLYVDEATRRMFLLSGRHFMLTMLPSLDHS